MAATVHPHPTHHRLPAHARLVGAPDNGPSREGSQPTVLRPIAGGRSVESRRRRRMYRRRRAMVLLGVVTVLLVGWQLCLGLAALFAEPAADLPFATPAVAAAEPAPFGGSTYVVQPGDTLWTIAHRVAPQRDPRAVVDELTLRLGGAPLQAGQSVDVAGLAG